MKIWKWIKSWFIKKRIVDFPTIILTIKPNTEISTELLAHFEFDWPQNVSDEVLAMYYGRVLAYIQSGALYDTILGGFEVKYEKFNPGNTQVAKIALHNEFQRVINKLNGNQQEQNLSEHLRTPCMMPSEVFNFRNKMERNGE